MGRAEFEYDEVGNTFYYVMLAFYSLILIPCTYFFFPHDKQVEEKVDERLCQCEGDVDKRRRKAAIQPWRKTKKVVSFVVLAVAWVVLAFLVQKVASIENTHVEYDPYSILELDHGASTAQIKKAYRDMSKKFHPDKGGDAIQFDRVAKAYQALTDDASRENWEKYGNPDGPTATQFGIALPKWLVSKEYGVWVLAFYGFIFMILLPTGVGYWWYNSIKYNVDKVLLDTTQLFGYFTRKTPRMEIHRAIMVLGGAFEFNKEYNNEIILREADDVELPRLMKHLPLLGENKKERPLCLPYSIKARIMLHAHLSRQVIEHEDILFDQRYFLSRTHRLIEEMLSIAQQINYYTSTKIPIETIDNLIKYNMHLRLEHLLVSCTLPALFHCVATKQVCPPPRVSPENPNVIILMVDDLALFYLPWLITTISKFLYQYPYVRKLPGPKGLPLIGNVLDLAGDSTAPLKFFSEEAAKARARGDGIFTMTVFGRVMTFPLNGDAVKAICESTEEITKGKDYDFLHPWMGNGIVFAIGQRWRDLRKSYTPIFHSRTMLEGSARLEG